MFKKRKEHNVPLFIGFNRRYDPQFRHLKNLFQQGRLVKQNLNYHICDPSPPPAEYVKVSGGSEI